MLLIGLPGSGKTHYVKNKLEYDYFVDDPRSLEDFPDNFISHKILVIADPWLCCPQIRKIAIKWLKQKYYSHQFRIIYFENNPEKCLKNIELRNDGRNVSNTFNYLKDKYIVPKNSEVISIYENRQ